jgi:hypothetical protein
MSEIVTAQALLKARNEALEAVDQHFEATYPMDDQQFAELERLQAIADGATEKFMSYCGQWRRKP